MNLGGGAGSGVNAGVNLRGGAGTNSETGSSGGSRGAASAGGRNTTGDTGVSVSTRLVAGMSDAEITRYRKRCVQVLAEASSFDRDLVGLCRLVQAARR